MCGYRALPSLSAWIGGEPALLALSKGGFADQFQRGSRPPAIRGDEGPRPGYSAPSRYASAMIDLDRPGAVRRDGPGREGRAAGSSTTRGSVRYDFGGGRIDAHYHTGASRSIRANHPVPSPGQTEAPPRSMEVEASGSRRGARMLHPRVHAPCRGGRTHRPSACRVPRRSRPSWAGRREDDDLAELRAGRIRMSQLAPLRCLVDQPGDGPLRQSAVGGMVQASVSASSAVQSEPSSDPSR